MIADFGTAATRSSFPINRKHADANVASGVMLSPVSVGTGASRSPTEGLRRKDKSPGAYSPAARSMPQSFASK